ncbi:MAG TPA: hypothetical protein VFM37_09155, partial [Pseudonocardiaceae bacterium]|nr:hypothetical protein [Pseudonocardiaceae bacterium]
LDRRAGAGRVEPPAGAPAAALSWQAHRLGPVVRMLQLAEPGSARFWQECWLAWASGGTLCLPGGPVTPETLHRLGITTVVAPYHVLRQLAASTALREVITPMAELRPSAEIVELAGAGVRLHAQYAVEGAGVVATQECTAAVLAGGYAPVLQDIAPGVRIGVCGPHGQVMPYGVAGRIAVTIGATRYEPGDIGHVDRGGAVHLHGAESDTVEWAGQKLVIPALERHLAAHPDVEDAVVTCRGHRPVAYLVPRAGTGFDAREARLHARRRSVPGEPRLSQVHVVAGLPRTPDGRIDRHAVSEGMVRR